MMRLFLGMGWVAYTPQPAIFDLRRSIIGGITIHDPAQRSAAAGFERHPAPLLSFLHAPTQAAGGIMDWVVQSWGRILAGYTPSLSIEITRECPLRCPGCYAYGSEHLGGGVTLRQVSDFKGQELIDRFMRLIDEHRPVHVSIVGGEPLVRFRELNEILPRLSEMGVYTQVVTSAVRPIPAPWAA